LRYGFLALCIYITILIIYSCIALVADNGSLKAVSKISAGEANIESKVSSGDEPLLGDNIPVAQVAAHQLEADSLGLARLEVDLLEASELADGGAFRGCAGQADVPGSRD
jgi:hypothetical protein